MCVFGTISPYPTVDMVLEVKYNRVMNLSEKPPTRTTN